MSNLLEKYEEMQKVAQQEVEINERIELLSKYAALADEMLSEKYKEEEFNEDDVIKVAEFLIESDIEAEEEQEKVAEYDELGRIMARSYMDELAKLNSED